MEQWVKEYVNLYFPSTRLSVTKIEQALQLKFPHIPNSLFRYRSFDKEGFSIKGLAENYIRLSYPIEFNDPFDARMKLSFHSLRNELYLKKMLKPSIEQFRQMGFQFTDEEIASVREAPNSVIAFAALVLGKDPKYANNIEEVANAIDHALMMVLKEMGDQHREEFQRGYLIACFSQRKDSVLMWSHYAANHTGFCIEYDFGVLPHSDIRTRLLNPVIYDDAFFDATEYYRHILLDDNKDFNNMFGIYVSMMKSNDWKYEEEWRLIHPLGPNASEELRYVSMPNPKAVYLGVRINEEHHNQILQLAEQKRFSVYQMELNSERYELEAKMVYSAE